MSLSLSPPYKQTLTTITSCNEILCTKLIASNVKTFGYNEHPVQTTITYHIISLNTGSNLCFGLIHTEYMRMQLHRGALIFLAHLKLLTAGEVTGAVEGRVVLVLPVRALR